MPFTDFGVDSLMAVELVNWIKKEMGVTVSQLDILGKRHASVVMLTNDQPTEVFEVQVNIIEIQR